MNMIQKNILFVSLCLIGLRMIFPPTNSYGNVRMGTLVFHVVVILVVSLAGTYLYRRGSGTESPPPVIEE